MVSLAVAVVGAALGGMAAPALARPAVAGPTRGDEAATTGGQVFQVGGLQLVFFACHEDGTSQPWKVPKGTRSVYVEAVGGEGMTPNPDKTGWGGSAGQVTGSMTVNPDDVLSVDVGCGGRSKGGASPYGAGGAKGLGKGEQDFAMTSYGVDGGGGGGASAVLSPTGKPLVVAGGGGGAAGGGVDCDKLAIDTNTDPEKPHAGQEAFWYLCQPPVLQKGGNGGDGGRPAGAGTVGVNNEAPATPGGGACTGWTQQAGQKGSDFDALGGGGAGGGGGGGYLGGCGGQAAGETEIVDPPPGVLTGQGGNGGGGGQSFADSGAVSGAKLTQADNAGDGYVLFLTGADSLRTKNYGFTNNVESMCVPAKTDRIFVDAVGGAGGGGGSDFPGVGTGGSGGKVLAVVPTTPGTKLQIVVGQYGHANGGWGDGSGGGQGDSGPDSHVKRGAGGGGSSSVKSTTSSCSSPTITGSKYLVVAGGGGGGGGQGVTDGGGNGGGGTHPAEQGQGGGGFDSGPGGCAGVLPGQPSCNSSRDGGTGTDSSYGGGGGGGGGGYNGGGKGHAPTSPDDGGGGGGGGGNSYAKAVAPSQLVYGRGADGSHQADGHVTLIVPFPSRRSEVAIAGGNQQSAFAGQPFTQPLQVQALDANGFALKDTAVEFTAPPGYAVFTDNGSATQVSKNTAGDGTVTVAIKAQAPPWKTGPFEIVAKVAGPGGAYIKQAEFSLFDNSVPTNLKLTSATPGNSSNPEQSVAFTAKVTTAASSPFGTPTGAVQYSLDGQNVDGPVPLDASGTVTKNLSNLATGVHQVAATYLGDAQQVFAQTGATTEQAVAMAGATVSLSSTATTAPVGSPVVFTAGVTGPADLAIAPTGSVRFSVDGNPVGTVALDHGQAASPPVNGLAIGLHTVLARYSGDAGFLPTVQTASEYVKAATSLSLVASPNPVRPGETLTLTATVKSTTPVDTPPAGKVQFTSDGKVVGTIPLFGGVATLPANLGPAVSEPHVVVATYFGEDKFQPSTATAKVYVYTVGLSAPGGGIPPPSSPPSGTDVRALVRSILDAIRGLFGVVHPAVPR